MSYRSILVEHLEFKFGQIRTIREELAGDISAGRFSDLAAEEGRLQGEIFDLADQVAKAPKEDDEEAMETKQRLETALQLNETRLQELQLRCSTAVTDPEKDDCKKQVHALELEITHQKTLIKAL